MKNSAFKIFALFSMVFLVAPAPVGAAANLVANGSFEIGNGTPTGWTEAGWGSSTRTFTHPLTPGYDGQAARILIEDYVEGDAKLVFDDVAVEAGQNYIYSDVYRSDLPSRVVARYNPTSDSCVTADTGCVYQELAVLSAASEWTTFQTQFLIPEDMSSVTIFHLIEGNGTLDLDSVSLEKIVAIEVTENVPNHSVEHSHGEGTEEVPTAWYTSSWGDNSPEFEYVTTEGEDGTRSVKVTLSSYVSGDAKWVYEPQPVTAGDDYRFSGYYKSDVVPHVVVEFTKQNGDVSYFGLQRPQPQTTSDWQYYEDEFAVPSGVVKATVFFFIDTVGWLQTDNYKIEEYSYQGFDRALVSLTFDDGAEANITTVLPYVNNLNIPTTHCYATSFVVGDEVQAQRVRDFYNAGHEICSHTITHPDLTTVSDETLVAELADSRSFLESVIGVPVPNFATPFGAYNEHVNEVIRGLYQSHRTVDEGYNSKDNLDIYRLKVQNMKPTTTLAEFEEWVNKAKADKTWLILVYHDVNEESVGVTPFGTYTPDFQEQMDWLAASGVTVKTYQDALVEVCDQAGDGICNLEAGSSTPPVTCPTGQHLVGNACVPDTTGTTTPADGNLVPNYGLEDMLDAANPVSWLTGKWGTNDAAHNYPVAGVSGNGAEVAISTYTDGDAKWYFAPVTVEPSTEYVFTDKYKSTTASEVILQYTLDDSSNLYGLFATVPSSDNIWSTYSTSFVTPANATALTVFHLINSVGSLTIDDYLLAVSPATTTGSTTEPTVPPVPPTSTSTASTTEPVPTAEELQLQIDTLVAAINTALAEDNKTLGSCVWLDTSAGTTTEGLQSQIDELLSAIDQIIAGSTTINGCPLLDVVVPPAPVVCATNQVVVDNQCVDKPRRGGGGGGRRTTSSATVSTVTTASSSNTAGGAVLGAATTTTSGFVFNINLTIGMSGTDVSELQKRLAAEGYYTGPVTGYFGTLTLAAVKAHQTANGIPDTGLVGEQTRERLNSTGVGGDGDDKIAELRLQLFAALKLLAELQAKLKEIKGEA